ncbi:hypothetical protein D9M73_250970 [compost metagenome]
MQQHRSGRGRLGAVLQPADGFPGGRRQRAAADQFGALAPALRGAAEEALRAAERPEADALGIDGMDRRQGVHQHP